MGPRSGIDPAWAWPLIVDGIIVLSTISVVALHGHGRRTTWYPWMLLIAGAAVSVTGNTTHSLLTDASAPSMVAACVSAVPRWYWSP